MTSGKFVNDTSFSAASLSSEQTAHGGLSLPPEFALNLDLDAAPMDNSRAEYGVPQNHPMDSSRILLGMMTLSRKAVPTANQADEELEGVVSVGVLRSLISALQFRDVATVQHSRRVAQMCLGVARHLGWEGRPLKQLEIAALLHDIGKIGVPDSILFKPGRLSPDESELMSLHHNIGVDVLQACHVEQDVLDIVMQSREHYNGASTGFRRTGGMLSMGGRILAVADAYDALRTNHVYRDGISHNEILSLLAEHAGTQFDGNVISALSRWMRDIGEEGLMSLETSLGNNDIRPDEAIEASTLCHIFAYLYLLESLYDGFHLTDSQHQTVVWNSGAEKLLGYTSLEMAGLSRDRSVLVYTDEQGQLLEGGSKPVHQVREICRPIITPLRIQHKDGHWVDVEVQAVPLLDAQGHLQGVAEIYRDVSRTSRKPNEYRELRLAASRDPLTGVANRGELETRLAELISDAAKAGWKQPFSVIFADVDHFKRINDRYGHGAGDNVLIEFTRILQFETYSGELVGRYGGEEFVMLCPATDLNQAVRRAERLRLAVSRTQFADIQGEQLTASFGVTESESGESVESIFRRADKALYSSKHAGRNLVRSLTNAQLLERRSQPRVSMPHHRLFEGRFSACVAADLIVYKLGGFVTDQGAQLLEVTPRRALLRLGTRGLFPFWGHVDAKQPVEVELEFGETPVSRKNRSPQVPVTVRIRPLGWVRSDVVFESRARRIVKQLNSYFAGEMRVAEAETPAAAAPVIPTIASAR